MPANKQVQLTAKDARELSKKFKMDNKLVEKELKNVYYKIEQKAKKGFRTMEHLFGEQFTEVNTMEYIRQHLNKNGFRLNFLETSRSLDVINSYYVISWSE